jgi:hypothetical protein
VFTSWQGLVRYLLGKTKQNTKSFVTKPRFEPGCCPRSPNHYAVLQKHMDMKKMCLELFEAECRKEITFYFEQAEITILDLEHH